MIKIHVELKQNLNTIIGLRKKENQVTLKVYLGSCLSEMKSLRNCGPFHSLLVSFIH